MSYEIAAQGDYELLQTREREAPMIALDGRYYLLERGYFSITEGTQGELVDLGDGEVKFQEKIREGHYKLVEFEDEPQFQSVPYLFLENGDKYDEVFLPQGLSRSRGERRRYIYTDHQIQADTLESYLMSSESEVRVVERVSENDEPPMDDYFDLTAGDLAERIRQMQPAELRRLEEYEERHKNRSTVLNTIRSQYRR